MNTYPLPPLIPPLPLPWGSLPAPSHVPSSVSTQNIWNKLDILLVERSLHLPDCLSPGPVWHILKEDYEALPLACFCLVPKVNVDPGLVRSDPEHIHRLLSVKGESSGWCHQCRPLLATSVAMRILNSPDLRSMISRPPVRGHDIPRRRSRYSNPSLCSIRFT